MDYVVTASEMKACDGGTIEQIGIPSMVLMERAALAVADVILSQYADKKRILIVAGKGNNGGDGLAIGRLLAKAGCHVTFFQMNGHYSVEAQKQRDILLQLGFLICDAWPEGEYDLIIDALLGIGITGEVRQEACEIIQRINEYRKQNDREEYHSEEFECPEDRPVICAVDLPSGIATDTGIICGVAVKADLTVTFQYLKRAHLLYPGKEYCGQVILRDVGIEPCGISPKTAFTFHTSKVKGLLPQRSPSGHKGSFGKVLLYAGSKEISGAALLCARAILCSGAGMLKVWTDQSNHELFRSVLPEAMLSTDLSKDLNWADVLVAGPGIGTSGESRSILSQLLQEAAIPMVLDADALNLISADASLMSCLQNIASRKPVILTPHPAELLRLFKVSMADYLANREQLIRDFQKNCSCILVSKDASTVVAGDENQYYINSSGNDGMATAGSGDVLTGVIGSLLAQGLPAFDAASKGVFLHGLAGDEAAKRKGRRGMIASDLIESLWQLA